MWKAATYLNRFCFTPCERIPQKDFSPKKRKHGLFSLHEHLWCYHLSCRSPVTSIRDYRLYVIIAAWWLAAHCFYTLFFMCPDASLTTYRGALNDYISSTSAAHLHLNLTHLCRKLWLRLNRYQERVLFFLFVKSTVVINTTKLECS